MGNKLMNKFENLKEEIRRVVGALSSAVVVGIIPSFQTFVDYIDQKFKTLSVASGQIPTLPRDVRALAHDPKVLKELEDLTGVTASLQLRITNFHMAFHH